MGLQEQGFSVAALTSMTNQRDRDYAMRGFASGSIQAFVCSGSGRHFCPKDADGWSGKAGTAEGNGMRPIPLVINFDLPHSVESYLSRLECLRRCTNTGGLAAMSLVTEEDLKT